MHVRRVTAPLLMTYAIVKLGGKQYRVQEGDKLLVDRLALDESKAFHPEVLFYGGDGTAELAPKGVQVTAKVVGHVLGDKITIGKHRKRTGYRRRNGFRARLSQVEIQGIAKKAARSSAAPKAEAAPAEEKPNTAPRKAPARRRPSTATAARKSASTRKKAE
jgi:large subunit ribosomal protein L21